MIDDDAAADDDGDLPDTAMMTGSEGGDPGDRPDSLPLTEAEKALLANLVSGSHLSVEGSDEEARAASDDVVLPQRSPVRNDDPINPTFREP